MISYRPDSSVFEEPAAMSEDGERLLKVLVVDDHPTNRRVVELMLEAVGAVIASAENGEEACQAFKAGHFDVVLMDVQMPVMDGLTATRNIRAYEAAGALGRTPILMLTSNSQPEDFDASQAAGADQHLTKPIHPTILFSALQRAIESHAHAQAEAAE
ncbi:MAG TPA: response regulator [Caulobacteraceae bacterium]|jgi:CheY-like chemotaxis protein|nr:response regulator [Caulobacteraceae bacterium]